MGAVFLFLSFVGAAESRESAKPAASDAELQGPLEDSTPLSPEEMALVNDAYNRWAASLRTLRASGRARVGAVGEPTRAFDFDMVLARPGSARLRGRWGALATIFDLSGNDEGWVLYLPRERGVVRSDDSDDDAGLLLPPFEIISVLLPVGIPPKDLESRGAASREGGRLRLVVPPGHGGAGSPFHRVLWVDPDDGKPLRLEVRRKTQLETPVLTAEYSRYDGTGPKAFPIEVKVDLVDPDQWASFTFETVRINTEVAGDVFDLRVPEGTREMVPGELTSDFLPEAESE